MPALNFAAEFAPDVESGEKTQTIRRHRVHPIKAGDRLSLWTGQCSTDPEKRRKLLETTCSEVHDVEIWDRSIKLDGVKLDYAREYFFGSEDGFHSTEDLRDWFRKLYGLPFRGQLIKWKFTKENP